MIEMKREECPKSTALHFSPELEAPAHSLAEQASNGRNEQTDERFQQRSRRHLQLGRTGSPRNSESGELSGIPGAGGIKGLATMAVCRWRTESSRRRRRLPPKTRGGCSPRPPPLHRIRFEAALQQQRRTLQHIAAPKDRKAVPHVASAETHRHSGRGAQSTPNQPASRRCAVAGRRTGAKNERISIAAAAGEAPEGEAPTWGCAYRGR